MYKPCRMCMVCRERKSKNELVRIVRSKSGDINLDETGKADGRGAYICKSKECIEKLFKSKGLNKSFKTNISQEVYDKILDKLK